MRSVILLAALSALAPFAIDTYLPAFPLLGKMLGTSNLTIQQSLTFYLFPYALMTLFHGAISDAIGRLRTIRWGLSIFILASFGCALSPNVHSLWFFRALQGVSAGVGNVVGRAMVRDLFQGIEGERAMATLQMLFLVAPAIAPIIGGLLLEINWQAIFIFLAIYAAVILYLVLRYLPETLPAEKRLNFSVKSIYKRYCKIFLNAEFLKISFALVANFSAFFIYVLASPEFLVTHLGLTSNQFAVLFIPTVLGMMLGAFLAKKTAGRLSRKMILRLSYGWLLFIAFINIAICTYLPHHVFWNIAPIALLNIGIAFVMPLLTVAALDCYDTMRGTVSSALAFLQMLCSSLSAGVLVPLIWDSPLHLSLVTLAYLVFAFCCIRRSAIWRL